MEKTTAGGPGDGVGGNRTERADRAVRPRFQGTVADGSSGRNLVCGRSDLEEATNRGGCGWT